MMDSSKYNSELFGLIHCTGVLDIDVDELAYNQKCTLYVMDGVFTEVVLTKPNLPPSASTLNSHVEHKNHWLDFLGQNMAFVFAQK